MKTLSDADLLGVLIGPRAAQALLQDGLASIVKPASALATGGVHVVRDVEAFCSDADPLVKIAAAIELSARFLALQFSHASALKTSSAVKDYLRQILGHLDHEVFQVLYLDTQHQLISSEEAFRGTINQTAVYPREIVKRALVLNAGSVIVSHNHPSGVVEPSNADLFLTKGLKAALELVDIRLLDHIVVAGTTTLSFAEKGLL
jgi:DNA repair protein RadC